MISIRGGSANEVFTSAAHTVLAQGDLVSPRGSATKEILGAHLVIAEPRRRLVSLPPVRLLNPAFAVAEAVWILSGSDGAWIFDYNRRLAEFADNGLLRGAYGPRLRKWRGEVDQLDRARRLLLEDPDTRRAVIQIYDPACDVVPNKDIPCTLNFRFFVREGRLQMHTTMRSQDLWLGFCYDIFTFSILHELMAHWIGAELGEYHHHVDSLHLYAEHWESAAELPSDPRSSPRGLPLVLAWEDFDATLAHAQDGGLAHPGWGTFSQIMRSYQQWKTNQRHEAQQGAQAIPGDLGMALTHWYEHLARRSSGRRDSDDTCAPRPVLGNA